MDSDIHICLSQKFVNKQNVRSFSNILRYTEFKSDALFQDFGDEDNILPGLRSLAAEIKQNIRRKSKSDFREYFEVTDTTFLSPVKKYVIFKNIWKALCEIVPRTFFDDNNRNVKIVKQWVESTVYSMRYQQFTIRKYIAKWDFSGPLWKMTDTNQEENYKRILCKFFLWMLNNILSPIISLNFYVTTCKTDSDEYKLHYFWKNQWQSFFDKKIAEMAFTKVIEKCVSICLGKKTKRNFSIREKVQLKSLKKDIPKLHLILKVKNCYRPIVQYKSNSQTNIEKYKIKNKLNFLKILLGKNNTKFETMYAELHKEWLKLNKPKLYFVKTDLSNAFGAVNKVKLLKILSTKHIALQKEEKNINQKKKYAQLFKDMTTELRRPLLVRAGSTIFEWKEGLVQGYKYSPALSELYYQNMDEMFFSDHFKNSEASINLFTRVVDDYLYITDSLKDAHSFLNVITNYRNINYGKTEANFHYPNIKFNEEITFLGYSYNTENMQVSRATTSFIGQMCYKIAFTGAVRDLYKFLENRISISGIPINGHLFNFWYNSEELIWKHIFITFCLSANKFCTTLAIMCEGKEMVSYLRLYKSKVTVKLSNCIVETLIKNKPADFKFIFCINHLRHLSWKALYLCVNGTPKCSSLIPQVKDELHKTNCLFGKWREHASTISASGEVIQAATKTKCRKVDLRLTMKKFDKLPTGFECYNFKILKQNI